MVQIPDAISDLFADRRRAKKRIADYLTSLGIRYESGKAARTFPMVGGKIGRPDFYLPEYDVYVHYWGAVDVRDKGKRDEYVRTTRWKIAQYQKNRVKLISLFPTSMKSLDSVFRAKFTKAVGRDPPDLNADRFCANCGAKTYEGAIYCGVCGRALHW